MLLLFAHRARKRFLGHELVKRAWVLLFDLEEALNDLLAVLPFDRDAVLLDRD